MRHTAKTKMESLKEFLGYDGKNQGRFLEVLQEAIQLMPPDVSDAMRRFYLSGEGQRMDPETGKPVPEDSRFYQFTERGREILRTLITLSLERPGFIKKIRSLYGYADKLGFEGFREDLTPLTISDEFPSDLLEEKA